MFELGLERGAGSHIDSVSGSHGQPEKGVFLPPVHRHEPWARSRWLETPLAEIGETHEKNCHTDVSLGLLLGIPACSDSNSPNTTGQSQPTTTGQQAPSTMGQQTPSAEPQHPTTIGQGPAAGTVGAAPAASTQDFVKTVAISDMFEIQASQLALNKDPEVDSSKVKATLPTALDDKHQKMLDDLRAKNGKDFDQAYDRAQQQTHQEAVDLFQKYADGGDNADLKEWAAKTLPHLKEHLAMAEKLK